MVSSAPSSPNTASKYSPEKSKKRKYCDRSIVPIVLLPADGQPELKPLSFGEPQSRRERSLKATLLESNWWSEEELLKISGANIHRIEDTASTPWLNATFAPILEEFTDYDLTAKEHMIYDAPRAARGTGGGYDTSGTPSAGSDYSRRGKQRLPSEGTDSSGTVYERPKLTYGRLIHMALESVPEKRMLFPDITNYIIRNFPYFGTAAAGNWQNSLRHQLSNTADFTRQERVKAKGKGKGGYWALTRWYEGDRLLPRPK